MPNYNSELSTVDHALIPKVEKDDVLLGVLESKLVNTNPEGIQLSWQTQQLQAKAERAYTNDPELVSLLMSTDVEALHGTRSSSLISILNNGLLPPSHQSTLSTPVISGEHYSQPTPREGVHVVHWTNAEGTIQFAEESTNRRNDGLSLNNYRDSLEMSDEFIQRVHPSLALRTHLENRKQKASELHTWLTSGAASTDDLEMYERDFPVVLGLSLEGVDSPNISLVQSAVDGDYFIKSPIAKQSIQALFIPEEQIEYLKTHYESLVEDVEIIALERLRTLTS
jgi:hypothetical protein